MLDTCSCYPKRIEQHRFLGNSSVRIRILASVCRLKDKVKYVRVMLSVERSVTLFPLQFTLTLWNPTIHPVVSHPRVPVTREYLIYDPTGNLVQAEVN